MFTFQSVVDQATKTAKQINAYVPNQTVRTQLDTITDAYGTICKTVYDTSMDMAKSTVEKFSKAAKTAA